MAQGGFLMRSWLILEIVFVLLLIVLLAFWAYVMQSARYSDFCEAQNYQSYGRVDDRPACFNSFDNNIVYRVFRDMGENDLFFIEPGQAVPLENWDENYNLNSGALR